VNSPVGINAILSNLVYVSIIIAGTMGIVYPLSEINSLCIKN